MDDMPNRRMAAFAAFGWEPRRRMDGTVEVSVNYFHENGRYALDVVSLKRYIELFDRGLLMWQREGLGRPEHNPPPEAVEMFLEMERERRFE